MKGTTIEQPMMIRAKHLVKDYVLQEKKGLFWQRRKKRYTL